jgi:putative hydrolase of the HAD superfamily
MRKPTTVFFDAGGTLLKVREPVGSTYARFAMQYGVKVDSQRISEIFPKVFRSLHVRPPGTIPCNGDDRNWWHQVVHQCLLYAGWPENKPTHAVFEALYNHYEDASCWMLFPETLPVLERLHAEKVPCYLLSNWDSRLRTILQGLGIYKFFVDHIISAELGCAKPHADIYQLAARRAAIAPSQAVMVGNEIEMDVAPALACGWRAAFAVDRPQRDLSYIFSLL